MVDLRAQIPDINTLIAARKQQPSAAENIQTGMQGALQGFQTATAIGEIVKKRREAQALAETVKRVRNTPEFQQFDKETFGTAGILAESNPEKLLPTFVDFMKAKQAKTQSNELTDEDRKRLGGLAKLVGEYKAPTTALVNMRSGEKEKLAMVVQENYPNVDFANYPANVNMLKGFTSGKQAEGMRRFDTSAIHINTLADSAKKIFSNPELVNKLKKSATLEAFFKENLGNVDVAKAKYALEALSRELATAYRGSGVTAEDDIKAFKSRLDPTQLTPAQFEGVGITAVEMMAGVVDSYKGQWKSLRDEGSFNKQFLETKPRLMATFKRFGVNPYTLMPEEQGGNINVNLKDPMALGL